MELEDEQIVDFLLFCLDCTLKTPYDEWDAHGGFDLTDDEDIEYDGAGLGDDDIDGYDDE